MHPLRARIARIIPLIRPLRSPGASPPLLRLFASKSPRLSVRPQLPFLAIRASPQRTRLISTEQKENFKYTIKLGLQWSAMGWTVVFGGLICWWFLRQDWLDRLYPSPPEWYFGTRWFWRNARHEIATEGFGRGMLDWSKIGSDYRNAVALMEDYVFFFIHRPTDIVKQEEVWDKSLPFADEAELRTPLPMFTPVEFERNVHMWPYRIGYDITMQSEAWRRGYFEAMLGLAKATEMREGYMTYKEDGASYPPQNIRSEANPYPVPLPPMSGKECPDISQCWPTFEPPEFHYKRILTTKGFNQRQRMDAGLAYASYLDHLGQHDQAEVMYRWSFDRALELLPTEITTKSILDTKTGVIKPDAPYVTPNIITCSTAFARHYADTGRINEALGIYLSVLRARRNSPSAPRGRQYPPPTQDLSLSNVDSIIQWLTSLASLPVFPDPPSLGTEQFERTKSDECEEAALSLYVAEILFAKMGRRREGLTWTQQATEVAEKRRKDKLLDTKGVKVCEQCLYEGLQNWKAMLGALAREQKAASGGPKDPVTGAKAEPKSESWFWKRLNDIASSSPDQGLLEERDWIREERQIAKRVAQLEEDQLNARINAAIATDSNWFAI